MTKTRDLADLGGGFIQAGGGVQRSVESKLQDVVSVLDFIPESEHAAIKAGTSTYNATSAIQVAINATVVDKRILHFPAGTYKVTDQLNLPIGTQLLGESGYQYIAGFGVNPKATKILFAPTAVKNLFAATGTSHGSFRFHYSIQGFQLEGNSADASGNSDTALYLDGVIYAKFQDIGISGFRTGIHGINTINNRFENIYASGYIQAVKYTGTSTTDVWDQCSFWGAPTGVNLEGTTIGLRFNSCLWEQCANYGIDLSRQTQNCIVTDAYCEDVPFSTAQADAAMFRVGYTGSTTVIENHLLVNGGSFAGRNAGLHGSLFDINHCQGIIASGFGVSRYVNVVKTNATNTRDNSVVLGGYAGVSWTNNITDLSKIAGIVSNGVINSGSNDQNLIAGNISASLTTSSAIATNLALNGDGTVTDPGITWDLDRDTGFWRPTNNTLAVSNGGVETARFNSDGKVLVKQTSVGSGGTLSVNGTFSLGQTTNGLQSFMSTVGMHFQSGITTSAVSIITNFVQGLSSAASCYALIFGDNNAGASFMDILVCVSGGNPVVLSSTTLSGTPATRTYTRSGTNIQLAMSSGTYNVNCRVTSMGWPF